MKRLGRYGLWEWRLLRGRREELKRIDIREEFSEFDGRKKNIVNIIVGMYEMSLKIEKEIVKKEEILNKKDKLEMNEMWMIENKGIFKDRMNEMNGKNKKWWREEEKKRKVREMDKRIEMLVNIREDRLRRKEKEGGIMSLEGNKIFVGEIIDMDLNIEEEMGKRWIEWIRMLSLENRVKRLEREFRVDKKRGWIVRN